MSTKINIKTNNRWFVLLTLKVLEQTKIITVNTCVRRITWHRQISPSELANHLKKHWAIESRHIGDLPCVGACKMLVSLKYKNCNRIWELRYNKSRLSTQHMQCSDGYFYEYSKEFRENSNEWLIDCYLFECIYDTMLHDCLNKNPPQFIIFSPRTFGSSTCTPSDWFTHIFISSAKLVWEVLHIHSLDRCNKKNLCKYT